MDVLAEALRVSGARGALGVVLKAGGSWGLWLDPSPAAALHVVARGTMWLHVPGGEPLEVRAGDAVLLAPGTAHGIAGGTRTTLGPCDREATGRALTDGTALHLGSAPAQTEVLVLRYERDPEVSTPVLSSLGRPMHVTSRENTQLRMTVELLTAELAHPQTGTTAAVNSIVDLLLIQFVRVWLARHPEETPAPGWARSVIRSYATPSNASTPGPNTPGPPHPWPPPRPSPARPSPGASAPPSARPRAPT